MRALLEQEELVSQLPGRIGHYRLESGHHSDLWIDLELLCLRPEFVQQRAAELAARLGSPPGGRGVRPARRRRLRRVARRRSPGRRVLLHGALCARGRWRGGDVVPGGIPACPRSCARASTASAWRSSTMSSVPARRSVAPSRTYSRAARTRSRWRRSRFSAPRGGVCHLNNLALENLGTFPFTLWTPSECPLCQAGVAVQKTAPGHARPTLADSDAAGVPLVRRARGRGGAARGKPTTDPATRTRRSTTRLSGELAQEPLSRWIAPEWRGAWNQDGLFREHPVGILLPSVLLIRTGVPAGQAAYIVNMVYQAAVIALIPLVAGVLVRRLRGAHARLGSAAPARVIRLPHPRQPGTSAPDVLPRGDLRHAPRAHPPGHGLS